LREKKNILGSGREGSSVRDAFEKYLASFYVRAIVSLCMCLEPLIST